jgi:hypothetical protein
MKRASANIWWIIIGAVIALVVMVILMVMFTSRTQPLEQGLTGCESKGGVCVNEGEDCPQNTFSSSAFTCNPGGCCIGSPVECGFGQPACSGNRDCVSFGSKEYCQ